MWVNTMTLCSTVPTVIILQQNGLDITVIRLALAEENHHAHYLLVKEGIDFCETDRRK